MSEFAAEIEDWSLQAIVRGSSGEFTKILDTNIMDDENSLNFQHTYDHQDMDLDFFDLSYGFRDELEELYKPFYPAERSPLSQAVLEFHDDKQICDKTSRGSTAAGLVAKSSNPANYTPKYKKRKNQHKRVMVKVSAEGLTSDMWAWRKYGQKPIKGSPYPRSYYRCSSSKGCLARKQVEQSCTDPGMFIITYTAEHSHSQPTRRNSLAGTVRQKFPTIKQEKPHHESSVTTNASSSPETPQAVNFSQPLIKQEHIVVVDDDINDFGMSEFVLDDDFFSGLQDFDEFVSEPIICHSSVTVRSCS